MSGLDDLKVDRTVLTVAPLDAPPDDRRYWHSRTPQERLRAVEILRQMN